MPEESTPEFNIRRYWAVVLKRRYLAIAVGLAIVSLFTWGSLLWPKTYEASSTVFIEKSSIMDPLIKGVGVSGSIEERLRNLKTGITSRNIVDRVMKKLDLEVKAKNSEQYEKIIRGIRNNLTVTVKGGREETDFFIISYTGQDPRQVRDVVNTLVSEYIEENVSFRRTDAYGAYEFIQNQLLEYKTKLEASDKAIREFRERNPKMVPQSENVVMTRIEGFESTRIETDIKLKELMRKRESLKKQLSGEKELTVAFVTKDSPQARLTYLNTQLAQLMTRFTDRHPDVIKVKGEIEELKRQIARAKDAPQDAIGSETSTINPIYQQLKEELAKTDFEIESLRARLSEVTHQQQTSQAALGKMPKEQEEWGKLQRDRNVYQKIYDDLLQKLENARVSKDLELTDKNANFRVIDPAVLPSFPVKPDRIKMILLGIALGIAGGIGIAIGLDMLDKSYKSEDAIRESLGVPVLASIPRIVLESDTLAVRVRDRKVLLAAGGYLAIVCLVLAREVLFRFMGIRLI